MIRLTIIPVALALSLGGCASRDEPAPAATARQDDDAICQSRGFKPGSDAYVSCRRGLDHQSVVQADKNAQYVRKMQDYMMDNK